MKASPHHLPTGSSVYKVLRHGMLSKEGNDGGVQTGKQEWSERLHRGGDTQVEIWRINRSVLCSFFSIHLISTICQKMLINKYWITFCWVFQTLQLQTIKTSCVSLILTTLLLFHIPQATHRYKARGQSRYSLLGASRQKGMRPDEALMDKI